MILGLSLSSSLQRGVLRTVLGERGVKPKVIRHVLDDVLYVHRLKGDLKDAVIRSYVQSLEYSHGKQSSQNKFELEMICANHSNRTIIHMLSCYFVYFMYCLGR